MNTWAAQWHIFSQVACSQCSCLCFTQRRCSGTLGLMIWSRVCCSVRTVSVDNLQLDKQESGREGEGDSNDLSLCPKRWISDEPSLLCHTRFHAAEASHCCSENCMRAYIPLLNFIPIVLFSYLAYVLWRHQSHFFQKYLYEWRCLWHLYNTKASLNCVSDASDLHAVKKNRAFGERLALKLKGKLLFFHSLEISEITFSLLIYVIFDLRSWFCCICFLSLQVTGTRLRKADSVHPKVHKRLRKMFFYLKIIISKHKY